MNISEPKNGGNPDPAQLQRTLWLFWSMFLGSSMVFLGLGYLLLLDRKLQVPTRSVSEGIILAAGVLAILVAEVALRALRKGSSSSDPKRKMFTAIGVFAAVESIAVSGLLLAVFAGNTQPLILLGAIAVVTFLRIALEMR
ncbi:MAG: hypothetical protein RIQ81_1588 [Pseudomonadota bacterium]